MNNLQRLRAYLAATTAILAAGTTVALAQPVKSADATPQDTPEQVVPAQDVPEPSAFEWSLLDSPVTIDKPVKSNGYTAPSTSGANWNRTGQTDGNSAVTVKQPLSPFFDANVGADMNVAGSTPTTSGQYLNRQVVGDSQSLHSTGSAWANLTTPGLGNIWDKTTIEARVDPSQDQSKLGTSLSKTVPLANDRYAVTVQGNYSMIDSTTPMVGATGKPNYRATALDQSAKLEFKPTGTSLLAGETMSTVDDKWLHRIGAEQKLFGGVSVTGTVGQAADGTASKSLTAGYKYSW